MGGGRDFTPALATGNLFRIVKLCSALRNNASSLRGRPRPARQPEYGRQQVRVGLRPGWHPGAMEEEAGSMSHRAAPANRYAV